MFYEAGSTLRRHAPNLCTQLENDVMLCACWNNWSLQSDRNFLHNYFLRYLSNKLSGVHGEAFCWLRSHPSCLRALQTVILRCTREGRDQTRLLEDVISSPAERAIGRCLTVRIVSEAVTTWMQSDPEGVHWKLVFLCLSYTPWRCIRGVEVLLHTSLTLIGWIINFELQLFFSTASVV
jgi:hypothetical protein